MTQSNIDNLIQAKQYLTMARIYINSVSLHDGEDDPAIHWVNLARVYTDSALLDVKMAVNTLWGKTRD